MKILSLFLLIFMYLNGSLLVEAREVNYFEKKSTITIDKLEKSWWGYRRYISNEKISIFSEQFDCIAAELSLFGGLSYPISCLNPIAGVLISGALEIASSYYWIIATYIEKVNKGNGVVVYFRNGFIFKIVPL